MKKLTVTRQISQFVFLSLFIYILWSTTYPLKGLIDPALIFKLDPLIVIFMSVSERVLLPGILYSALMLLATLILGRFFCGWVCPLGTLIDYVGALRKKKRVVSERANAVWRKGKFVVLGAIALLALAGIQVAWFFDPLVIAARFVSMNLIPSVTLAVEHFFIAIIETFGFYGPVYDLYRDLKVSFLGVKVAYVANSTSILLLFFAIVAAAWFISRLWCRFLCPLGASYALTARGAFLERNIHKCIQCGRCRRHCRMGAIRKDISYAKGECILCMDCVYDCPKGIVRFQWRRSAKGPEGAGAGKDQSGGITRKEFLVLLFSSLSVLGYRHRKRAGKQGPVSGTKRVIRPPGALEESHFVDRCIRCGNCMKVCVTNGLQPVMMESGLEGIWTPQLVPEIGCCEYRCNLCGQVCPTGAIPKLELGVKQRTKLGHAHVDKSHCIAWAEKKSCIVCEEHCPVPDKAIKLDEIMIGDRKLARPVVDKSRCIGCGICQNVCPVRPERAIKVYPRR